MARGSNWNLGKGAWVAFDLAAAASAVVFVTLSWNPYESETLRLITPERLILYGLFYGLAFVVAGEVLGLHEAQPLRSWRFRVTVACVGAMLACLALLFLVYGIEFRFIGRFVLLKIGGCSVLSVIFIRAAIGSMASRNRPRVLALVSEKVGRDLGERVEAESVPIDLENPDALKKAGGLNALTEFCRKQGVDEVVTMRSDRDLAKEFDATWPASRRNSGQRMRRAYKVPRYVVEFTVGPTYHYRHQRVQCN